MSVGEWALVVKDKLVAEYDASEIILEYAFHLYGDVFDDLIWDMDDECVLGDVKSMAGDDWQRVLGLVSLWILQDLQREGYFMSDD